MQDRFLRHAPGLSAPATRAVGAIPSDTDPLPFLPRAIYVGRGGDLALSDESGGEAVWKNVPAGAVLPFRAAMIRATGTTAADLVVMD
ncbi:conserved hypothetical protein [Altererythrobacter sp. B11]|uniref:spike base protein, RCAP_Rcc01079 family n=1 Tax=Altererythrobacter sp. B11 TaxID=2060312 RepID=UPI000DC71E1E|nr:hypothetical protein [Altererythrobacter sp. B11]BBC70943.1 conserved hypothetical protein [Altererythrobacter sp. B11]